MGKIVITLICVVLGFLWVADTTVQWKPFKMTLDKPLTATGLLLLGISIGLIQYEADKKAYHRGFKEGVSDLGDYLINEVKQKAHDTTTK